MTKIHWFFFVLWCRLKGEPLTRVVERYAIVVKGKKPFQRWVSGLRHSLRPAADAQRYAKVYLLPFDISAGDDKGNRFGLAINHILLDILSDFAGDEDDVPKFTSDMIHQWFDFETVDEVMDYSSGRIRRLPPGFSSSPAKQ